jgi:hypothetical protein
VKALKFLLPGGIGPFSGFPWEPGANGPGAWHDTDADPACGRGVHACEVLDLPFWLQEELWLVELRGEIVRGRHKVVGAGGRLLGRIAAWDDEARADFAAACARRGRELAASRPEASGHVADVEGAMANARAAAIASLCARTAEAMDGRPGYDAERAAQAAWLAERLGLEAVLAS